LRLMIPPETADVTSATGLPSDGDSCISPSRPGEARPERGGRGRVGRRTREMARTGGSRSESGGSADSAADRGRRDGPDHRFGLRAAPAGPVGLRLQLRLSAAAEGRRVAAVGLAYAASVGRAGHIDRPAAFRRFGFDRLRFPPEPDPCRPKAVRADRCCRHAPAGSGTGDAQDGQAAGSGETRGPDAQAGARSAEPRARA
jgi:hypothetical protein